MPSGAMNAYGRSAAVRASKTLPNDEHDGDDGQDHPWSCCPDAITTIQL